MKQISMLLVMFVAVSSAQATLLTNGDFNTSTDGWNNWAGSWDNAWVSHEAPSISAALTGVYDGSLQISIGGGSGSFNGKGLNQVVAGTEGVEYTLTFEAGAQDWWKPVGSGYLKFLDGTDTELASHEVSITASINVPGDEQYDVGVAYQDFTVSAVAPTGTTQVKVEFAEWDSSGTIWVDNVALVPEPATMGLIGLFGGALTALRRFRIC